MDPISILGISLATIVAGEAILAKMYSVWRAKFRPPEQETVSSPVSNTM